MIYGQLQYYNDELNQWSRTTQFQKGLLEESRRQIDLILTFPLISLPNLKAGNLLLDRITTQVRRTDYLSSHVNTQMRRLRKVIAEHDVDAFNLEQQQHLRAKMRQCKLKFVKATCDSSTFISAFFELTPVPVQV